MKHYNWDGTMSLVESPGPINYGLMAGFWRQKQDGSVEASCPLCSWSLNVSEVSDNKALVACSQENCPFSERVTLGA